MRTITATLAADRQQRLVEASGTRRLARQARRARRESGDDPEPAVSPRNALQARTV
jgi:hypothetical protein